MTVSAWYHGIRSARFAVGILVACLVVLACTDAAGATGANFDNVRHYPVGQVPTTVESADFDGDGNLDLAAQNAGENTVTVRMGSIDGTFERRRDFPVGSTPTAVTSADFNGDTRLDLAVANQGGSSVSILKGNGDGSFEPFGGANRDVPAGPGPSSVSSADLNSDGKADLAVANFNSSTVTVLLGNGDGGFQSAAFSKIDELIRCPSLICAQYPMMAPNQVITGHFNADSHVDLATANMGGPCGGLVITCHPGGVSVLLGRGDGTLEPARAYPLGPSKNGLGVSLSITAAHLDADGIVDLATTVEHAGTVRILGGTGSGTFVPRVELPVEFRPSGVSGADLDGDGESDDLAVANFGSNNVSVLVNDGTGTFQAARNFPAGDGPIFLTAANFNDDNDDGTTDSSDSVDLAVANQNSNNVSVLLNTTASPVPDTVAPTTTHTISPQPNTAGWNRDEVTVTLTAADTGSGVQDISYRVNDGAANTVLGNVARVSVRNDGATTITYHATDRAGNRENARTLEVRIDKSAPTLDTDSSDGSDGITPNNRETGVASDVEPAATFSDGMDPASLREAVDLYRWNVKKKKWQPVPVGMAVEGATVKLNPYPDDPRRMLAAGTKYRVNVTTGAKNLAGIPLETRRSWTFTTAR